MAAMGVSWRCPGSTGFGIAGYSTPQSATVTSVFGLPSSDAASASTGAAQPGNKGGPPHSTNQLETVTVAASKDVVGEEAIRPDASGNQGCTS